MVRELTVEPGNVRRDPAGARPLLEVANLRMEYGARGRRGKMTNAVDGVSFKIAEGETLALVGESGCGKSTVGRAVIRLLEPTDGTVNFAGDDITHLRRKQLRPVRRNLQMVFQDPMSALDPRQTMGNFVREPFLVHGWDAKQASRLEGELFERVGLTDAHRGRYAHELSGGQRQRVVIARALALEPKLLVLDEPVASLDVRVQANIVRLLQQLQRDSGLSYLFISHDLAIVRQIADRVAVMYRGKLAEVGDAELIYQRSQHPYTRALLSAAPVPDPRVQRTRRRIVLRGEQPDPAETITGCPFRTRCWRAEDVCAVEMPALAKTGSAETAVACHFPVGDDQPLERDLG